MYHSVTFGNKNTYSDWHLVPTSRPVFTVPEQKTKVLELPGANGLIDLSTSLTGYPIFNNRQGENEFLLLNGFGKWEDIYSDILNNLHGRTMNAYLEDDPDWYYTGRYYISEIDSTSGNTWTYITIGYDVDPYKKYIYENTDYRNLHAGTYTVPNTKYGYAPVTPTIEIAGASVNLTFMNNNLSILYTATLTEGSYVIPDIIFYGDQVTFELSGVDNAEAGTTSIIFRKESL